jgi:hypothetical protein
MYSILVSEVTQDIYSSYLGMICLLNYCQFLKPYHEQGYNSGSYNSCDKLYDILIVLQKHCKSGLLTFCRIKALYLHSQIFSKFIFIELQPLSR